MKKYRIEFAKNYLVDKMKSEKETSNKNLINYIIKRKEITELIEKWDGKEITILEL